MKTSPQELLPSVPPFTDLYNQGISSSTLRLLRCSPKISNIQLTFLARVGAYWVRPILGRPGSEVLALRLQPGLTLVNSPLLLLYAGQAITLAEDARDLVPAVLAWDALNDDAIWTTLRKLSTSDWDGLNALHSLCGGKADLSILRKLVQQKKLQQLIHGNDLGEKREHAVCQFLLECLPQQSHQVYRQYLDRLQQGTGNIIPLPQAGAFSAAVSARALLYACQQGDRSAAILSAWAVFAHPPMLDTSVREQSGQVYLPNALSGDRLCCMAARVLHDFSEEVPESFRQSPIWSAITQLGNADILGECDGQIFLQVSQQLVSEGSLDAAFNCLLWNAACSYSHSGRSDIIAMRKATELAQLANWTEIHATLLAMTAVRDDIREDRIVEGLNKLADQLLRNTDS